MAVYDLLLMRSIVIVIVMIVLRWMELELVLVLVGVVIVFDMMRVGTEFVAVVVYSLFGV